MQVALLVRGVCGLMFKVLRQLVRDDASDEGGNIFTARNVHTGNGGHIRQTAEFWVNTAGLEGLKRPAVLDDVGRSCQAVFVNQEMVDVFGNAFEKVTDFVFLCHVAIHDCAQLQDFFDVHSACLPTPLGSLGKGLFRFFLLRKVVTKTLCKLVNKLIPTVKHVLAILEPEKRGAGQKEHNVYECHWLVPAVVLADALVVLQPLFNIFVRVSRKRAWFTLVRPKPNLVGTCLRGWVTRCRRTGKWIVVIRGGHDGGCSG